MILWIASYPRSGNLLIRTVFHQTMGLKSTTVETDAWNKASTSPISLVVEGSWGDFYEHASRSQEVYLVKTHRPPLDDQPAVYVLRDGRKSCLSYSYFHKADTPEPYPSLFDIVVGRDFYGSWSDHYRIWQKRENMLVVRYEHLVHASSDTLKELAHWARYRGAITPWLNPFSEQKRVNPKLFREGKVEWSADDPAWTPFIDSAFFKLHGRLMIELGYASEKEAKTACSRLSDDEDKLLEFAVRELKERRNLERICREREAVISELNRAAGEKKSCIQRFASSLKKRCTR